MVSDVMKSAPNTLLLAALSGFSVLSGPGNAQEKLGLTDFLEVLINPDSAREKTLRIADALLQESRIQDLTPPYVELSNAIYAGDFRAVKAALSQDLALNQPLRNSGDLPLNWCLNSTWRSVEIVQLLLDHGADATLVDKEGNTAFHYFARAYNAHEPLDAAGKIVAVLIANGADIEARQNQGWTPMHLALMHGSGIEFEALLLNGADPNSHFTMALNQTSSKGFTPLMQAGYDVEIVRLLLQYGADPAGRSLDGQSVLEHFEKNAADSQAELAAQRATGEDFEFELEDAQVSAAALDLIVQAIAAKN